MLKIKVLQPNKIRLDSEISNAYIPGIDGDFEVYEGHTPFITKLRPGTLSIWKNDKAEHYAIHDGFITVENDKIVVVSEIIEHADEIDEKRAKQAKKRAEERLNSKEKNINYRRAEFALQRSIARIQTKK